MRVDLVGWFFVWPVLIGPVLWRIIVPIRRMSQAAPHDAPGQGGGPAPSGFQFGSLVLGISIGVVVGLFLGASLVAFGIGGGSTTVESAGGGTRPANTPKMSAEARKAMEEGSAPGEKKSADAPRSDAQKNDSPKDEPKKDAAPVPDPAPAPAPAPKAL